MSSCDGHHPMDIGSMRKEHDVADDRLDELIAYVMGWQEHTMKLTSENHTLSKCITEKDKQLKQSEDRYTAAKQEQKAIQEVVSQLQEILKKQCNLEDQNIELSTQIAELKEQIATEEKRHHAELIEVKRNSEDLELAHSAELTDREEAWKKKASEEREELEGRLKASRQQAEHVEQQLAAVERDKQAQLVKLRLEYDAKLLKLQNQKAKNQQHTSQAAGATQDIFRKKLQHQREEHEREVNVLKRRITELEQKQSSSCSSGGPGGSKDTAAPQSTMFNRRKVNFKRS